MPSFVAQHARLNVKKRRGCIQVMNKICRESEASLDYYSLFKAIMKRAPVPMSPLESLASSAVRTAHKVRASCIIIPKRNLLLFSCLSAYPAYSAYLSAHSFCASTTAFAGSLCSPRTQQWLLHKPWVCKLWAASGACVVDSGADARWVHGAAGGQVPAGHPGADGGGAGADHGLANMDVQWRTAGAAVSHHTRPAAAARAGQRARL